MEKAGQHTISFIVNITIALNQACPFLQTIEGTPATVLIEVVEGQVVFCQEILQSEGQASILFKCPHMIDQYILRIIRLLQIFQNIFFCVFLQLDIASSWKVGESFIDLLTKGLAALSYYGLKLHPKVVFLIRLADKIKNCQTVFTGIQAEAATQLLQEYRCALCRTQEKNSIYLGDVYAFVVEVHNEYELNGSIYEVLLRAGTNVIYALCRQSN